MITRIRKKTRKQETEKNLMNERIHQETKEQESWLKTLFSPRQPRFGLRDSCQEVKIFLFGQESCIGEHLTRILPDGKEVQESGKNEDKNVD